MTENFLYSMPYVFLHEGGYNNRVNDHGGATNWGISLAFLQNNHLDLNHDGHIDYIDIKTLDKDHAEELYLNNFWKIIYDQFDKRIAAKVFDTAVNAGNPRAHIILQRAINSLGARIPVDGMIGKVTIGEINKMNEDSLLRAFCAAQRNYYDAIIIHDPTQKEYEKGWHNRAAWLPN